MVAIAYYLLANRATTVREWSRPLFQSPTNVIALLFATLRAGDHARWRAGLNSETSVRPRLEGQGVNGALPCAIVGALHSPRIADAVFVAAALLWLIPDRRIEKRLAR